MKFGPALIGAAGLVALVGCSQQPGLSPDGSGGGTPLRVSVRCTAEVANPTITCDPIAAGSPAAGGGLITGGQGTYVLLASSGTSYNSGTQIFQSNVTVQNRSAQPLGSTDGNFVDDQGVRVFFINPPTTTGGTGVVTVNNPDSILNITGPNQPAFVYPELLMGGQTSAPALWRFNVPTTVTSFIFQVQVSANIPQVAGVLRWRQDGARLNGVSCLSASSCFAVGDVGTVRFWNGSGWLWSATGTTEDLNGVTVFSSTLALAIGTNGTVLRWNGGYWKALTSGTSNNLHGVWCATATDCYIAGDAGLVLRWNGTTFSTLTTGVSDDLLAVWGVSASDIRVVGANGRVLRWGGSSFTSNSQITGADLTSIWGTATNNVYAVGTGGATWKWTTSWAQLTSGTTQDLKGVWGFSATNIFAVGANGTVRQSVNGTNWSAAPSTGATQTLVSASGAGTTLLVVGAGGTIINSANSGTAFSTTASGTDNNLNGVWGTSANNVYAVGDAGTILHWDGTSVSLVTSGTTARLNGIWGSSASDIYAVGDGGVIRHSTNGTTWTAVTGGGSNDLSGVWGSSASDIYAVGKAGTVRHSIGGTFTAVAGVPASVEGTIRNINAIWGASSSAVYAVGDTGLILHYNGSAWAQQPYETGFPQDRDLLGIWGTGPADIWIVARHTVILHNNGVIDSTVHYDPLDTSATYTGPWDHIEVDGTVDNYGVFGVGAGDVFSVGDSGLVLHQNDPDVTSGGTGAHWSHMSSITLDRKLRGLWAASTTNVFIVGERGLFFRGSR